MSNPSENAPDEASQAIVPDVGAATADSPDPDSAPGSELGDESASTDPAPTAVMPVAPPRVSVESRSHRAERPIPGTPTVVADPSAETEPPVPPAPLEVTAPDDVAEAQPAETPTIVEVPTPVPDPLVPATTVIPVGVATPPAAQVSAPAPMAAGPALPSAAPLAAAAAAPIAAPGAWPSTQQYSPPTAPETGADPAGVFPESFYEEPPTRAGAHWWGVFLSLVLTPVAWYLLVDGGARVYWSLQADPSDINVAGLLGLAGGTLALIVVMLAARWSSVGAILAGSILTLVGLPFLVIPELTLDWLAEHQSRFESFGGFGTNLYAHIVESGTHGQFVVAGVFLIFVGVVSHGARRQGRREERARLGLKAAKGENPFA